MGPNKTVFSQGIHHPYPANITTEIQDFEKPPQG